MMRVNRLVVFPKLHIIFCRLFIKSQLYRFSRINLDTLIDISHLGRRGMVCLKHKIEFSSERYGPN